MSFYSVLKLQMPLKRQDSSARSELQLLTDEFVFLCVFGDAVRDAGVMSGPQGPVWVVTALSLMAIDSVNCSCQGKQASSILLFIYSAHPPAFCLCVCVSEITKQEFCFEKLRTGISKFPLMSL